MNSTSAQNDLAPRRPLSALPSIALLTITLVIYLPVILHGGFIWDDPQYIVRNPTLRDASGLIAIWIHPTSIPQYYPLVHTTFWIEYHFWGLHPAGYHLDNVLLHGLAAILLYRTLQILRIPGAWLAAAIFAVHPINVESVAWATERKNVLSAVFYFSSLIAYLRFAGVHWRIYFLSLLFFLAALLSKSVTCSLPAAIVLLIYWRDGRVPCREFLRLIPFFIAGLAMALLTGWLEKQHVGASGREWSWTFPDRCLIAGKALWFYLGKIFWPHPLSFVYPKWPDMSFSGRPDLIVYPISFLALLILLFLARRTIGRGPFVAVLYFSGTLLPALGFVNLYPMRYTFVADHYQYLAAIGIFVPIAAILSRRLSTRILAVIILCILAGLTIHRQSVYQSALVLWQDTVAKNPNSFMVWGNLGDEYADLSNDDYLRQPDRADARKKARDCYAKLIELAPDQPIAHYKWAIVKEYDGDLPGAQSELQTALDLQPDFTPALDSMGEILMQMHKPDEAMGYFRKAIALDPRFAEVRYHFGYALEQSGQIDEAIEQYVAATRLRANYADAEYNMANLLFVQKGRADLAVPYYSDAVLQHPNRADYRTSFAAALWAVGQNDAAREQCRIALQLQPDLAPAKALWQHLNGP
jgi:protein O-mannosyl-transferase